MDGYIRVSRRMGREGPGYISPSVQREAIIRWADYRGIEIIKWHIDEDQSGGTQDRPGLREAMRRVESSETGGIACWKINRFARNVAEAIQDVERIQGLGAHLVFVTEEIDTTGPMGSALLTIMLAVSKLERDNLVQGWKTAKGRAVDRGAKISPTPYGYLREPGGTLTPHPVEGTHITQAYHLAASQGIQVAHAYLLAHAPERTWTPSTARRTLANRVYLGEVMHGSLVNAEAHEPLVTRAVWEAAQHEPTTRRKSAIFPLSGLAVCETCGNAMVGGRGGPKPGVRTYRCQATLSYFKGARCARGAHIVADRLEGHVRDQMRPVFAAFQLEARDIPADHLTLAERAMTEAEAELSAFAADLTARRVLGHRYHENLTARAEALETAQDAYRRLARAQQARETLNAQGILDGDDAYLFGQLLRSILASIVVAPGRGALSDRVRIDVANNDLASGPALAPDRD
jgi:DNA invertase Pin-like site-specific DNA recombinase